MRRVISAGPTDPVARGEHLDRRMLDLWRLQALFIATGLAVVAGGTGAVVAASGAELPLAVWIVGAGAVLAVLAGCLAWASVDYRNWTFEVTDEALELHHGVLVQAHSTIPLHRVQQIDVHAGPLDRLLGLRRLMVRTAASSSDATIPGIAVDRAEDLRRRILRESGEDDAV